jgi:hypothetical protein
MLLGFAAFVVGVVVEADAEKEGGGLGGSEIAEGVLSAFLATSGEGTLVDTFGSGDVIGSSSDSHSSSDFLVGTAPGTRMVDEHFGQLSRWPARFDGARSFRWH